MRSGKWEVGSSCAEATEDEEVGPPSLKLRWVKKSEVRSEEWEVGSGKWDVRSET